MAPRSIAAALLLLTVVSLEARQNPAAPARTPPNPTSSDAAGQADGVNFRSVVDLVNVTATVTDLDGHFVSWLTRDDFRVYEDDVPQTVTNFGADRVPVSLGIVLDTSGSMAGEKIRAARTALEQFLDALDDPQDEFFLYQFSDNPLLLQGWTRDREEIAHALSRVRPDGGTALFEAVARAVPMLAAGHNQKKALVVISDGNDDGSSRTRAEDVQQIVREREVLVYAIGIDGDDERPTRTVPTVRPPRGPEPPPIIPRFPIPVPRPGPRWPGGVLRSAQWQWPSPQPQRAPQNRTKDNRVNVTALRNITDDSGGRTEIVRDASDLLPVTSNIADELSRQYSLGYPAPSKKDGRWHSIRVEVSSREFRVRARRGYVAS